MINKSRFFLSLIGLLLTHAFSTYAQTDTTEADPYLEVSEQKKRIFLLLDLANEGLENQPVLATEQLLEAKKLSLEIGDTNLVANAVNMMGNIRYYAGDSRGALVHWKNALGMAISIKDSVLIGLLYNNVANAFKDTEVDSCIHYYLLSEKITLLMGDTLETGDMLANLALVYYDDTLVLDQSEAYNQRALAIFEKKKDEYGILMCNLQKSRILVDRGKTEEAIKIAELALQKSREITSPINEEMALDALRMAYHKAGQDDRAFAFSDSLIQFIDELREAETLALVTDMEKQIVLSEKQKEISFLNEEKSRTEKANTRQKTVIATSIIGIVLLFFLGYKMVKEKKRSDELLLNILPFEVAEELKTTGKAKAKKYDSVSVIFTDFKDFSKISETVSPEVLVDMIDEHFSAFDRVIDTYGLEKIKTIGDSYMAAGGIPVSEENHAEKTVQAALEMQQHMAILRKKKKRENKPFFETRIGVHSGPVVAGVVGIKKFAYDIWGDTVNIAARLEKAGEPGKVNISASTHQLVKDKFNCTYRGKIPIKNLGEIDMYFVG